MTKDEIIERALREAGIFPPPVLDCHYADRTELAKAKLIVRSLEEMGLLSLSGPVATKLFFSSTIPLPTK